MLAETIFGWGRHTVAVGLAERRTGILCLGAQAAFSGRKRWEDVHPQAADALRQLAEAHAQQAPTFRTPLASTRLTAKAALSALRDQGVAEDDLPSPSTMATVLNRLGFRLRKAVKAKPQKKIPQTDAIFATIKKKISKRPHQAPSNAGVSTVRPRCSSAMGRVAVSREAMPGPVIMTWDARRSLCRVALWRKMEGSGI